MRKALPVTLNSERTFYENPDIWLPQRYVGLETERARLVIKWLPAGISSVLDVGCGNGVVTNQIQGVQRVVGVDRSLSALAWLRKSCCQADIISLPFMDNSFDVVMATEVIEHLPFDTFKRALSEMERVARRYLLITVPYREELRFKQVRCPICQCCFNPSYHMRSFDLPNLKNLFGNRFVLVKAQPIFPVQIPMSYKRWAEIFNKSESGVSRFAICPQCGYSNAQASQEKLVAHGKVASILRTCAQVVLNGSFRWWVALYSNP